MIPLAFTILLSMLPRSKKAIGLAGFSMSAAIAPAIGSTIAGYFTENYGWPYVFYVGEPGLTRASSPLREVAFAGLKRDHHSALRSRSFAILS